MERDVKQVLVVRRDLGMRRGKEIAQGAHASMAWLTRRLQKVPDFTPDDGAVLEGTFSLAECAWMRGTFTKVVCQVPDEAALRDLHDAARRAGLESYLITDAGKTEFGGVPTATAVGVGPDWSEKVDAVTRELKLY